MDVSRLPLGVLSVLLDFIGELSEVHHDIVKDAGRVEGLYNVPAMNQRRRTVKVNYVRIEIEKVSHDALSEIRFPILFVRVGEQFQGVVLQVRLSRYFLCDALISAGLLRRLQPVHNCFGEGRENVLVTRFSVIPEYCTYRLVAGSLPVCGWTV